MKNEMTTLQKIFQDGFEEYTRNHRLPMKIFRAANAIMRCRTAEQGGHYRVCPDGHEAEIQYHSCRHRSCPQCNELMKSEWLEKQKERILSTRHYHVIFTLPHELLPLWKYNVAWFSQTLFHVVSETLMTLLMDERHLGAKPGLMLSLHTWGRNLTLHPHIHCLVTGGGLDKQGQWQETKGNYLLPSRVVRALYQGKLLAALTEGLNSGKLKVPPKEGPTEWRGYLTRLRRKKWNVCIQPPYEHGEGVVKYLARYVKGGPISNRRLMESGEGQIGFRYTDHRDGKSKVMTLKRSDFISRIVDHVFEPGQHAVRYYGLYAHQCHAQRARASVCLPKRATPSSTNQYSHTPRACATCKKILVRGPRLNKISYIVKNREGAIVQQEVEAVRHNVEIQDNHTNRSPAPFFWRGDGGLT